MSIHSSDVYALILSFSSTQDQVDWSVVSKTWKHLVYSHPSLFHSLDLTLVATERLLQRWCMLGKLRVRFLTISMAGSFYGADVLRRFPNLVRIFM